VQIVIPPSLVIALVVLIVICVVTLGMMVRVVTKPELSQALRLNED
jgi:Tfp pilus assembly protein PilX